MPRGRRYAYVTRKFGSNPDIDTGTDPETIWEGGGLYPWSGFAAGELAMTVVSDDTNDTAGGTGARTVMLEGLDENFRPIYSVVSMDGTSTVACGSFFRLFRGRVLTAGSSDNNIGNITVANGGTTYMRMSAGLGTSQLAIYTVPDVGLSAEMRNWWAIPRKQTSASLDIQLRIRDRHPVGSDTAWQTRFIIGVHTVAFGWQRNLKDVELPLDPGDDIELRVAETSASNVGVSAGFDVGLLKGGDIGDFKTFQDMATDVTP